MPTRLSIGLLLSLATLVIPAVFAAEVPALWQIDHKASSIRFFATQAGAEFEGGFKRFTGEIRFSSEHLAASSARVVVDTGSVDSQSGDRDDILRSDDWFAPGTFPEAVFVANEFTQKGPGVFTARAELTMRDVTQPVAMDFTLEQHGSRMILNGTVALERLRFGLGQGDWQSTQWIADAVRVEVVVVADVPL